MLSFNKIQEENLKIEDKTHNLENLKEDSTDIKINHFNKQKNLTLSKSRGVREIKNNKISDLLNNLKSDDFKFNFCDFLKSLVSNKKKDIMYEIANKNLDDSLDISNYLQLKPEIDLIKELLLDKQQLLIFNTFSTVINFKKMFKEITKIHIDFKEYDEDQYKKIFDTLNFIIKRQNDEDKKIIKFIKIKGN